MFNFVPCSVSVFYACIHLNMWSIEVNYPNIIRYMEIFFSGKKGGRQSYDEWCRYQKQLLRPLHDWGQEGYNGEDVVQWVEESCQTQNGKG